MARVMRENLGEIKDLMLVFKDILEMNCGSSYSSKPAPMYDDFEDDFEDGRYLESAKEKRSRMNEETFLAGYMGDIRDKNRASGKEIRDAVSKISYLLERRNNKKSRIKD